MSAAGREEVCCRGGASNEAERRALRHLMRRHRWSYGARAICTTPRNATGSPNATAAWCRLLWHRTTSARAVVVWIGVALAAACSREAQPATQDSNASDARASERGDAAATQAGGKWFVDVTAASGVDFVHDAGLTPEKHLPETMGAGAALVDVDGDGDLDLYVLQGGPMRLGGERAGEFREPEGKLPTNRLYLNDGAGKFVDATARSGAAAHSGYAMGVAAGDVNGDGHVDLYVTNLGADVLLIGDGTGFFRNATQSSGLRDERWTSATTFFDAEGDGDLDLYVAAYVEVDLSKPLWCGERKDSYRSACHPDAYPGLGDRLWINRGDGTFVDATQAAGLSDSTGKGLGVIAGDFDRDGDLDLYVANDSTENRLWFNRGDGTFEDGTLLSGTGVDGRGMTEAGMGLASGDVDGDGDLELFVTNFDEESNTLYSNLGGGMFDDVTMQSGLEAPSWLWVGFGCVLEDFDLDGDLDLAVANGHIIDNIALYHDGKTHAQFAQLFENDGGGRFKELIEAAGELRARAFVGRGLYAGDLDGDGDADLVLTECGGRTRLYRNVRGAGGLAIRGAPRNSQMELGGASGKRVLREQLGQPSYFGQGGDEVLTSLGGDKLARIVLRVPYSSAVSIELSEPIARGRIELVRTATTWSARVATGK